MELIALGSAPRDFHSIKYFMSFSSSWTSLVSMGPHIVYNHKTSLICEYFPGSSLYTPYQSIIQHLQLEPCPNCGYNLRNRLRGSSGLYWLISDTTIALTNLCPYYITGSTFYTTLSIKYIIMVANVYKKRTQRHNSTNATNWIYTTSHHGTSARTITLATWSLQIPPNQFWCQRKTGRVSTSKRLLPTSWAFFWIK